MNHWIDAQVKREQALDLLRDAEHRRLVAQFGSGKPRRSVWTWFGRWLAAIARLGQARVGPGATPRVLNDR